MKSRETLFGTVPEDWNVNRVGDIAELRQGLQISTKYRKSEQLYGYIPLLKITDLPNKEFSEYVTDIPGNYIASKDDIIYTRTGQVGLVYTDVEGCVHNNCFKVIFDYEKFDKYYMYYYLKSKRVEAYSNAIATGSVQKDLTHTAFNTCSIGYPSVQEQKIIGNILSTLDNKIKANNKINQKLEEMAQVIFKQWFIDFDFPNEEGKPYKSSGGEMVESELGMIPKGWKVGVFRNYITDILGGDWGKEVPQGNYTKEVQCIRGADIPEINKGNEGKAPTRFILEKNFKNKQLTEGNLIVEISGGSPTQSTGRISYINDSVLNKFDKDIVCTNFCRAMTLKDRKLMEFVYIYWSYLYNLDVFFQFENGTTGIKNLDINNFLDRWDIVNPSEELINKYYEIARDLFIKIQDNGKENERLSRLRDTLLPKLMSGEIRVPTNN